MFNDLMFCVFISVSRDLRNGRVGFSANLPPRRRIPELCLGRSETMRTEGEVGWKVCGRRGAQSDMRVQRIASLPNRVGAVMSVTPLPFRQPSAKTKDPGTRSGQVGNNADRMAGRVDTLRTAWSTVRQGCAEDSFANW